MSAISPFREDLEEPGPFEAAAPEAGEEAWETEPEWELEDEDTAVRTTPYPASALDWPGASDAQLAFMRAVYERTVQRAQSTGRSFIGDLPAAELKAIYDHHRARKDAAGAARALLAEARTALAADGLADKARIGIVSAYRSAAEQWLIWQGKNRDGTYKNGRGGFPYYYAQTAAQRRRLGDEHGPEAVELLTRHLGKYIAAPGFSDHNNGIAIDFGTGAVGKGGLGKLSTRAWFHRWLVANAARFGFVPLPTEAWHWEYQPHKARQGETEDEEWSFDVSPESEAELELELELELAAGVRAGRLEVDRAPVLDGHRGSPPALLLRWNDMPAGVQEIDVVVHLHGYSRRAMTLPRDIERWSGLDLGPVDGATGAGRTRPTLTVLPRGHMTGRRVGRQRPGKPPPDFFAYTFPELTRKDGLPRLVAFALERFAEQAGATPPPRIGRLILTAHSGGGAALLRILEHHDPHEVHVFDGLYQDASALARWAQRRIQTDRAAGGADGALRVFYGRGTRHFSERLAGVIAPKLPKTDDGLASRFRVEASTLGHWEIPRQYGWRVLASADADVPNARRATGAQHEAGEEFAVESEGDHSENGLGFESWAGEAQLEDPELSGVFETDEEEDLAEAQVEEEWSADPVSHEQGAPGREAELKLIEWAIHKGGSPGENIVTDLVFHRRHPELKGRALRASETALVREWRAIRDTQVRPYVRHSLELHKGLDPVLLATYLSQYEDDDRVPVEGQMRFLWDPPIVSMGRTLRDRVLWNWHSGEPPLTPSRFFDLAYELTGNTGYAALLCHNVTKAFARGGKAIHWQRVTDGEGVYTGSGKQWTARRIHPDGVLLRKAKGPSIYYLLFSSKEFGTEDEGDWYHYFVAATMGAFGTIADRAAGRGGPSQGEQGEMEAAVETETILNERPNPVRVLEGIAYPILLRDALGRLRHQMTDPRGAATAGYTGWVFANTLSFLEGAFYGKSQKEVARESGIHMRGAIFGVERAGQRPDQSWRWYVPKAGSVREVELVAGFSLSATTAETLSAGGAEAPATAVGAAPAGAPGHGR